MLDSIIEELSEKYKEKSFLSLGDVCDLLGCERNAVYNWTKRADPQRRPPRILVGREIRFPKKEFLKWLCREQGDIAS